MNNHDARVRGKFNTPLIQGAGCKPPKRKSHTTQRGAVHGRWLVRHGRTFGPISDTNGRKYFVHETGQMVRA